ncbi:hypothetical protein WA171_003932, partial [Blastocystis sp. BT1]
MSNSDVNQQAGNVLPVVQGRMLSQPSTDGNPVLQQVPVAVMMPMKQDEPQDEDDLPLGLSMVFDVARTLRIVFLIYGFLVLIPLVCSFFLYRFSGYLIPTSTGAIIWAILFFVGYSSLGDLDMCCFHFVYGVLIINVYLLIVCIVAVIAVLLLFSNLGVSLAFVTAIGWIGVLVLVIMLLIIGWPCLACKKINNGIRQYGHIPMDEIVRHYRIYRAKCRCGFSAVSKQIIEDLS